MPNTKESLNSNLKVALVYDQATTQYGGAENVLLALHNIFPQAPLYTLLHDQSTAQWTKQFTVIPSFLQLLPGAKKLHRLLSFLAPIAFEQFDFSNYDIIISITSASAKGIITHPRQLHLCYLLTPTRYLYSHKEEYLSNHAFFSLPGIEAVSRFLLWYIQWWDMAAAYRPDVVIPISQLVKKRVEKYYHLNTRSVIYPPVDQKRFKLSTSDTHYFNLCLSRLVSYKKIDTAIQACLQLQKMLVIAGDGPEKQALIKLGGQHVLVRNNEKTITQALDQAKNTNKLIVFLGAVSDQERLALLHNCRVLIMPGEEDFGITALEAGLMGKPVLLSAKSGAAEIIVDQVHGLHLNNNSISEIIKNLSALDHESFNSEKIKKNAQQYTTDHFENNFKKAVTQNWSIHSQRNSITNHS